MQAVHVRRATVGVAALLALAAAPGADAAKPKKPRATAAGSAATGATAGGATGATGAPATGAGSGSPAGSGGAAATGDPGGGAPATAADGTEATEIRDFTPAEAALKTKESGERVTGAKEKVFRAKSLLIILRETILGAALSIAKIDVVHRSEMGATFRLERLVYTLDGSVVFSKAEPEELEAKDVIDVWTGELFAGDHQLNVEIGYRGYGFGVFAYLSKYTFKVKSAYTLRVEGGKHYKVAVVGYEKDAPIEERPTVRFDVSEDEGGDEAAAPGKDGKAPPK